MNPLKAIIFMVAAAAAVAASDSTLIEPKQTNLAPQTNVLYTLVTPPMLFETHQPGPREETTSRAWKLANEFVFRTSLSEQVQLPALKAVQHKIGVMVHFTRKDSEKEEVLVFVRSDMKTIEYKGTFKRPSMRSSELPPADAAGSRSP